jgi:hypothetical protein
VTWAQNLLWWVRGWVVKRVSKQGVQVKREISFQQKLIKNDENKDASRIKNWMQKINN